MTDHNARQAGLIEAADFIANKADTYAREHGVSDMGSLSFGNDDMRDYHWGLLELADEIRALAAHSADARNGEAVALTDMRWRDVSVEKPTHAQQVLFVRNGKVHFGAWINDIFWYSNEKVCALYWMPLPEAPTLAAPAAPAPTKLDDDLLATIRTAATTRAEGATTQDGRTVFINYGDSEQQMIDADALACPHCGGSGHVADVRPAPAPAAQADEALREEIGVHVLRALKSQAALQRAIHSINNGDVESAKTEIRRAMHANIEKAPTGQTDCLRSNVYKVAIDLQKLASDLPDRWLRNEFLGVAEQLVNLCQIPDIAQQSATPAECTCPSGNGSLRHPCPAHSADPASEADKRDAERYRWLRAGHRGCYNTIMIYAGAALDDALDEAIRAAMSREQSGGEPK